MKCMVVMAIARMLIIIIVIIHQNHFVFKFNQIVANSNRCQFESLSPSIKKGNDVLVMMCSSLSLVISSLMDGDPNVEKGHSLLLTSCSS